MNQQLILWGSMFLSHLPRWVLGNDLMQYMFTSSHYYISEQNTNQILELIYMDKLNITSNLDEYFCFTMI